jgi:hypothetical protein
MRLLQIKRKCDNGGSKGEVVKEEVLGSPIEEEN